jgi:DNA-binding response OmpR family regulator
MAERILVVDDDEYLALVLRDGLTHYGYTVEVASSGTEALAMVLARPPDLIVLDLLLPGLGGVEVCRQIHVLGGPPVIMLTALDAVEEKVAGLEAGADDYLTKPYVLAELVARVRAVLRRHAPQPVAFQQVADLTLDLRGRLVWRGQRRVDLTAREFDLIAYLVEHAGQVLTHSQLLEHVWGYDSEIESNVVKVYIATLRAKLNMAGEPDLIQAVRGVGYVLRAKADGLRQLDAANPPLGETDRPVDGAILG